MIGAGADQIGTGQLSASSRVNSTVEVADTTDGNSELEVCIYFTIKRCFSCLIDILFVGFPAHSGFSRLEVRRVFVSCR